MIKLEKWKFNLENIEKTILDECLKIHCGNIRHAADDLGITRVTLYRKRKKHKLNLDQFRAE